MSQRKDPAERSKRRGSENRQRQHLVGVRLTDGELDLLDETARRMKRPRAELLRNGALVAADLHKALRRAEAIIKDRDSTLSRVRSLLDAAILIGGERYVRAEYIREALEGDSDE